ncbi:MAG TPA: hypothetical protein VNG31_00555, partial [Candidatus Baltobacteraceae bacterium]|nr:hypothetical protein [Candidatus Baltobacteraceae bacterium]
SIGVWLDGADVTYRSDVTGASFAYKPPAPLAFGSHTVRVAFTAFGGQRFDRSWSFTIAGAPPVNPVELRAQQPAPGAGVTNRFALISAEFTREVDGSSVRVRLDGNDITSQCGVSRTAFSYKPPAPLELGSHTVRVTGRGLGGSTFDRAWSFRVTAAPVPSATLAIKQPGENAVVGSSFVIRGSTFPNGRVRVTAGATPATTGEFDRSTVAGQLGNFSLKVVLNAMPGQQTVTLKITAVDPATSQTAQTTLQLRLGP